MNRHLHTNENVAFLGLGFGQFVNDGSMFSDDSVEFFLTLLKRRLRVRLLRRQSTVLALQLLFFSYEPRNQSSNLGLGSMGAKMQLL